MHAILTWSQPKSVMPETRGKAILQVFRSAREAGYHALWTEIRAVRYPEADEWASHTTECRCYREEDVRMGLV